MRSSLICALIIILVTGCSREWVEFRGNQGLGVAEGSISPPVAIKWKFILQKQTAEDRRYFNQPLLKDNTIYFGSADGNFYSLDLRSGFMNWRFRSEGPINSVATVDENAVYFGSSDGKVYAVSRESGELLWNFQSNGQVNSTLISYKDMIAVASDADAMYFFDRGGELRFTLNNSAWYRVAFQIFDDILAFAPGPPDNPSALTVYDLDQQEYLWELSSELRKYYWYSFPAVKNRRLYLSVTGLVEPGIWEHYFASYDLYNGRLFWEQTDPAYIQGEVTLSDAANYLVKNTLLLDYAAPLVWRKHVIFAMGDSLIRSYHARTGRELWKKLFDRPISTAATLAGDRLYFGLEARNGKGELVVASPASGKVFWSIEVEGSILNSPVIAGPWIIFGTDEGLFYVLEEVF